MGYPGVAAGVSWFAGVNFGEICGVKLGVKLGVGVKFGVAILSKSKRRVSFNLNIHDDESSWTFPLFRRHSTRRE